MAHNLIGNSYVGTFDSVESLPPSNQGEYAVVGDVLYVAANGGSWDTYSFKGIGITDSDESYSFEDSQPFPIMGMVAENEEIVQYIIGEGEPVEVTYKALIENPPYQVDYKVSGDTTTDYSGPIVNMYKVEVGNIENEQH